MVLWFVARVARPGVLLDSSSEHILAQGFGVGAAGLPVEHAFAELAECRVGAPGISSVSAVAVAADDGPGPDGR